MKLNKKILTAVFTAVAGTGSLSGCASFNGLTGYQAAQVRNEYYTEVGNGFDRYYIQCRFGPINFCPSK